MGQTMPPFLAVLRVRKHLVTKVFPKLQTAQIEKLTKMSKKPTVWDIKSF